MARAPSSTCPRVVGCGAGHPTPFPTVFRPLKQGPMLLSGSCPMPLNWARRTKKCLHVCVCACVRACAQFGKYQQLYHLSVHCNGYTDPPVSAATMCMLHSVVIYIRTYAAVQQEMLFQLNICTCHVTSHLQIIYTSSKLVTLFSSPLWSKVDHIKGCKYLSSLHNHTPV